MNNELFKTILAEVFSTLKEDDSDSLQIEVEKDEAYWSNDIFILTSGDMKYRIEMNIDVVCSWITEEGDDGFPQRTFELVRVDVNSAELWINDDELKVLDLPNRIHLEKCMYSNIYLTM